MPKQQFTKILTCFIAVPVWYIFSINCKLGGRFALNSPDNKASPIIVVAEANLVGVIPSPCVGIQNNLLRNKLKFAATAQTKWCLHISSIESYYLRRCSIRSQFVFWNRLCSSTQETFHIYFLRSKIMITIPDTYSHKHRIELFQPSNTSASKRLSLVVWRMIICAVVSKVRVTQHTIREHSSS